MAVIPGLLARLRNVAPSVSLRLRSINRISILEELDTGKLDLGIGVFDLGQIHHKRRPLYSDSFLCLFNPAQLNFIRADLARRLFECPACADEPDR